MTLHLGSRALPQWAVSPAHPHASVGPIPPSTGLSTGGSRRRRASRLIDLVTASLALIVLSPLVAVLAVLTRLTSRGPALFKQMRLGQHREPFTMLKFRTMRVNCDDELHREYVRTLLTQPELAACGPEGLYKLVDDPRITRLGHWLRRTSLDELPQLINVLRGEMSLVGPRPVLSWEAALFDPRHDKRFEVPPGITGLWQITGRNRLTMTQALDLDVQYVESHCVRRDLAILVRTVPVVLGRRGVE